MIPRELQQIVESDLQALIEMPVMENDRLEYKAELALSTDDQKRKFLAGIAAFANGVGGDIVYGMEAQNGRPVGVKPLAGFDPDQTLLRLRDLMLTGIDPSIFTAQCQPVNLAGGGFALVIRIPKTWAGAHMVTFNGENRFYVRHGGGRRLMQVSEIRTAFSLVETVSSKIQRYRLERIGNILSGESPCPLNGCAALVFHIVPFRSFDPSFRADLSALQSMRGQLKPLTASGGGDYYDVDGIYIRDGGIRDQASNYIYVFRNGAIEMLDTGVFLPIGDKMIPSLFFEQELLRALPIWLKAAGAIGAPPPFALMLTLLNVKDFEMGVDPGRRGFGIRRIQRDHLQPPATVLEVPQVEEGTRTTHNNVAHVLRPHFEAIWNACGYPKSHYYGPTGDWVGNDR